jgi:hypothetical protein
VAAPYSASQLRQIHADALRQRTLERRRASRALFALGAGAGLDGRWAAQVWARDVTVSKGVVLVQVGEPAPRSVPVLAHWEAEMTELADSGGDELLVGGHSTSRNRASSLISRLEVPPGHPKLSLARLRSTWLIWHLAAGTRLPELAAAAGLQGVAMLSDLLEFVPALPQADAQQILRGADT